MAQNVLNEIRLCRDNHTEKTAPYDENKLIDGAKVFFENHPLIKELADALEQGGWLISERVLEQIFQQAQSSMGLSLPQTSQCRPFTNFNFC